MFKKDRDFIVEEKDVMDVLKVINNHLHYLDGQVGNCGWGGSLETKWFISFKATDKKYICIVDDLKEIGHFTAEFRPKGQMDIWFLKEEL